MEHLRQRRLWTGWLSGLHVTYLVLDAWHRLFPSAPMSRTIGSEDTHSAILSNFRRLVLNWQADVEASGGAFYVVLLPGSTYPFAEVDWPASLEVVDLDSYFQDAFARSKVWRFNTDPHWNEVGNLAATHRLYRFLEDKLALPHVSDDELAGATHVYYQAFARDDRWPGQRWLPSPPWAAHRAFSEEEGAAIRARYMLAGDFPVNIAPYRAKYATVAALEPQIRSQWNVHVLDTEIVYLQDPCRADDLDHLFVLRLVPAIFTQHNDVSRVVHFRSAQNFDTAAIFDGKCMMTLPLPDWPVATISTGQRDAGDRRTKRWWATFVLDDKRFRRAYHAATAAGPAHRAPFDVYRVDNDMIYIREPCTAEDARARFFLHVFPAAPPAEEERPDTAPVASPNGQTGQTGQADFMNLNFNFTKRGMRAEGRCVAIRPLPEYHINRIDTGQLAAGKRLWWTELHY